MNKKQIALAVVLADFARSPPTPSCTTGVVGLFEAAFANAATITVFADLTIALSMVMAWMWQDARQHGVCPIPYVAADARLRKRRTAALPDPPLRSRHRDRTAERAAAARPRRPRLRSRHALPRDSGRDAALLQGLGDGETRPPDPRLAAQRRHVGVPDAGARGRRLPLHRRRSPRLRTLRSAGRRLRLRHFRRRPRGGRRRSSISAPRPSSASRWAAARSCATSDATAASALRRSRARRGRPGAHGRKRWRA